jgi:hypothetical protein
MPSAAPSDPSARPLAARLFDRQSDPSCLPPAPGAIRGSLRSFGRPWPDDPPHLDPLGRQNGVRASRFQRLLSQRTVDLAALRALAWSGVPPRFRLCVWQTLLAYLPPSRDRHESALSKRRQEYRAFAAQYFGGARIAKSEAEQACLRQVLVDVARTAPGVPLFRCEAAQRALERVLYVWAQRHPASGYVQGINDLATPFFAVFLAPWVDDPLGLRAADAQPPAAVDLGPAVIDAETLLDAEADVFWCLTRLLSTIQDHYTPGQPGLQRAIYRLRELCHRLDEPLVQHLESSGVEFHTFAPRWVNCLLLRELPFRLVPRLWDACLAEPGGFDAFNVYVCAALLLRFSAQLKATPKFEELISFMQHLPTADWTHREVEELLSQAYVYKAAFDAAPKHLL